jgi:hypothetical protein
MARKTGYATIYRTVLEAGTRSNGLDYDQRPIVNDTLSDANEAWLAQNFAPKPDVTAHRKLRAKSQARIDESKGIKGRGCVPAITHASELPRYDPAPVARPVRLSFAGRDKLKVKGFGPWAKPS